jgi:signal transduction histidine kinase
VPGAVAHDFRNMLQCATSALRVTRRRLLSGSDVELAETVADALEALERANLLAHRLMSPSRATSENVEAVDVAGLILSLRSLLRHALGEGIHLRTLVSADLPPIRCDRHQLENVLVNLATNARDAMPEGGSLIIEALACNADAHRLGRSCARCVAVSVIDTGSGMSAEVETQAFTPFFTTKGWRHGTGLGLSSVREFAEALGGSAEIRTAPGTGTRVRLHLPASIEEGGQ